ncbi:hypothetical protein BpHYR1_018514 [Brachionus plicatilis]|uniref:Uncharacterized protein n=1 Tax=Brachionus plicatilis TaxID=10195 RepID=A0A3M7SAT2_BRAPC|nr:hypothetical protein BpHYR1_018514 [Brachionus plicatilis]
MKPNKKFKVDQVISSLLESESDSDNDSFEEDRNKEQNTPLKSIENRLHSKIPIPTIELKTTSQEERKIDENLIISELESEDDEMPLSVMCAKKFRTCSDSDEDDEDVPLSVLVSKKTEQDRQHLASRLNELDKKYDECRKKLFENRCFFFKGIHDFSSVECVLEFGIGDKEFSYVDDSDYEEFSEAKVPSSPILKLESNFCLAVKNLKRKM